jgi:hypothetical protein
MCIICLEFERGRMTAHEARRALGEMVPKIGAKHAEEVERTLREAPPPDSLRTTSSDPE